MKTTLKARRILLDEEAAENLEKMMFTLRETGGHVSRSPSKAASWIISDFSDRYFLRDKDRMREALFNRKTFLKSMLTDLKDGNDEEIERLEITLRGLRQKRKATPKGRANADEIKSSDSSDAP